MVDTVDKTAGKRKGRKINEDRSMIAKRAYL